MRNIFCIFKNDIKKLHKNVIALIVVMGICIVPCLYAWFNIAANFDPYANTDKINVGIVNEDRGYSGEIFGDDINFGRDIMMYLSENPKLNWILTDRKNAMKNLKMDKYYAVIVIPEDFSKDMLSLFSKDIKKPKIIYYVNEKKNAIAPKITDKGAQGVLNYINQLFLGKIYRTAIKNLDYLDVESKKNALPVLSFGFANELKKISENMDKKIVNLKKTKEIINSVRRTIADGNSIFLEIEKNSEDFSQNIYSMEKKLKSEKININQIDEKFSNSMKDIQKNIDFLNQIEKDFSDNSENIEDAIEELTKNMKQEREKLNDFQKNMMSIDFILPEMIGEKTQKLIDLMDNLIIKSENIENDLKIDREFLKDNKNSILKNINILKNETENIKNYLGKDSILNPEIKKDIESILKEAGDFSKISKDIKNSKKNLNSVFDNIESSIDISIKQIEDAKKKTDKFLYKIGSLKKDKKLELDIIKKDPEILGDFLKAPVHYKTNRIFLVKNYGSAMAPFYSTLAIWVGAIVMASMMKVKVEKESLDKLKNPKLYQIYFGRHIIFTVFGLVQSSLIILGDVYYLGIQCENIAKLLLAGWITSIVYVNIVYTLTVSFGDVGKALAVVVMVMQVAGSGGTFPIQVTPEFFQKVYPFLPFVHSMNAMRECICGFYKNIYTKEILTLLSFMIPSLMLGLVFRKPVIKLNDMFTEKLEETKLM